MVLGPAAAPSLGFCSPVGASRGRHRLPPASARPPAELPARGPFLQWGARPGPAPTRPRRGRRSEVCTFTPQPEGRGQCGQGDDSAPSPHPRGDKAGPLRSYLGSARGSAQPLPGAPNSSARLPPPLRTGGAGPGSAAGAPSRHRSAPPRGLPRAHRRAEPPRRALCYSLHRPGRESLERLARPSPPFGAAFPAH